MLDQSYYETANEIISRYPLEEKSLIPIIQDIQATYRYLPPDLLDYVAKKIGITETKAYSVASFYENFSFEQKGKYVLKICDRHAEGTSRLAGAAADARGRGVLQQLVVGAHGGGHLRLHGR